MQNIQVFDDGVTPVEIQKIVIKETETKTVETVTFDGTLTDAQTELERAKKNRDSACASANAEVTKWENIIATLNTEVAKLPERVQPPVIEEVVTP